MALNLVKTRVTEAKGTSNNILTTAIRNQSLHILHSGVPIITPSDVPEFDSYINKYITKYNRYLGYPSGLTSTKVTNAFTNGIKVFSIMIILKRFYDSKGWKTPTGKETDRILGNKLTMNDLNANNENLKDRWRIGSDLQRLSNAEWNSYFISPFTDVVLPSSVMSFYNYYLSNYFDITNMGSNDSLSIITFWPEFQNFSLYRGVAQDNDDWATGPLVITRDKWNTLVANMRTSLSDDVQEFVEVFLDWVSPMNDMTRDLDGDSVSILRDKSLLDQLNNMYPESTYTNYDQDGYDLTAQNQTARVYRDFEPIYKLNMSNPDLMEAEIYYYALNASDIHAIKWTKQQELDSIIIDYNAMLFMCIMATNESTTYGFCMYSMLTTVNLLDGYVTRDRTKCKQISVGNDIEMALVDETGTPIDPSALPISYLTGLLEDYNNIPEVNDEIAIFKYGFSHMKEYWIIEIDLGSASLFVTTWRVFTIYGSYGDDDYVNDFWNYEHGLVHSLSPNEVNAAIEAVSFKFLSMYFESLADANDYISSAFKDKVQAAVGGGKSNE